MYFSFYFVFVRVLLIVFIIALWIVLCAFPCILIIFLFRVTCRILQGPWMKNNLWLILVHLQKCFINVQCPYELNKLNK